MVFLAVMIVDKCLLGICCLMLGFIRLILAVVSMSWGHLNWNARHCIFGGKKLTIIADNLSEDNYVVDKVFFEWKILETHICHSYGIDGRRRFVF